MKILLAFLITTNLMAYDSVEQIDAETVDKQIYASINKANQECKFQINPKKTIKDADGKDIDDPTDVSTNYDRLEVLPVKHFDCKAGVVKDLSKLDCVKVDLPSCTKPELADLEAALTSLKQEWKTQFLEAKERRDCFANLDKPFWSNAINYLKNESNASVWINKKCNSKDYSEFPEIEAKALELKTAEDNAKAAREAKKARLEVLKTKGQAMTTAELKEYVLLKD